MSSLRLIALAMKYHWEAQRSNPANLFAAVVGMIVNNIIVLWGLWAMLFDGKPNGHEMTIYFLTLNGMLVTAWGTVCFVGGGLHNLGTYVEEGSLEPMLSTPRHPLLLAGLSRSLAPALGDVIQGLVNLVALFWLASVAQALRCVAFTFVGFFSVVALFVLTGSVPFFVRRGNGLAQLLRECCLSLSFYPTGKIFSAGGRVLLFLTPAAATAILPMQAIDSGKWSDVLIALGVAIGFLWLALRCFEAGLKRYQTSSYVLARD